MNTDKANRPAFPNHPDNAASRYAEWREGITIRDYFAAKVITGAYQNVSAGSQSELAKRAYEIADAMINQREQ
jgi:hypothetical protein